MATTFLTPSEITAKKKYTNWCKDMGVDPVSDYEDLLLAPEGISETIFPTNNKDRREVINIYLTQCKALGKKPSRFLEIMTAPQIWDYVLKEANVAVEKEFGEALLKVDNVVLRAKIRSILRTLYDELILIKKEEANELFECSNDNNELERIYKKLGGTSVLAISNITTADEEEEEDDEEDYEDD